MNTGTDSATDGTSGTGESGSAESAGPSSSAGSSDTTATSTTDDSTTTSTTDDPTTDSADSSSGSSGPGVAGCGDGTLDDGEGCDDGNTASGDGCSAACQDETAFCDPRVVGTFETGGPLGFVSEAGAFPIVATTEANPPVILLDISDPTEPLHQSSYTLGGASIVDLIGRSDRAFAVGDPLVTSFDISGGNISLADQIDGSSEFGFQAALQGTTLYIADDSTTRVVNAAGLSNLNLTSGHLTVPGVMFPSYDGVAAGPGRAYVSVNGLLGVFDISNAFSPALQGTVSLTGSGPLRVTDDQDHVVSRTSSGIAIYDVSDPADPSQASVAAVPAMNIAVRDIATLGNFVYATTSNGRVYTFDITDPTAPIDATEIDLGVGAATAVHPGTDFLYVIRDGIFHLVADLPGYCTNVCGNGVVEYPEICDDGDLESGDECDADCTL